jgi:hypothetical protein
MTATASVLMRAFRGADSSFFMWRAGSYDPTMSDATGDQAPPFPPGDYSDHVVTGLIGGPLARTDATGTDVLGNSGAPATFGTVPTYQATASVVRDFAEASCFAYITNKAGAGSITLQAVFAEKVTPAAGDFGSLTTDDAPTAGVAPQFQYQAEYDVSGETPPFVLGPFNVPIRGPKVYFGIKGDAGAPEGYLRVVRIA